MGWRFSIEDANIVAYLTTRQQNWDPPRFRKTQLIEFLRGLGESISITERPIFIAQDPNWAVEIAEAADKVLLGLLEERNVEPLEAVDSTEASPIAQVILRQEAEFVSNRFVSEDLASLKRFFDNFELYALPIDRQSGIYSEFAEKLAREQRGALILLPLVPLRPKNGFKRIDFFDPFPAAEALAQGAMEKPGILFWTKRGATGFISNAGALKKFAAAVLGGNTVRNAEDYLKRHFGYGGAHRILHLSDLHFGTNYAVRNKTRLKNEIRRLSDSEAFDRIVITGDLYDNPAELDALEFADFRNDLKYIAGKEVIVVPGNHDQKYLGIVGRNMNHVAGLEWTNLVIDHDIETVFLNFNSAADAKYARGRFCETQRDEVKNAFDWQVSQNEQIRDYHRVALIHHHPFTFETSPESLVQRGLRLIGLSDERFLKMENADMFVDWCGKMEIPTILHGHKHAQWHAMKSVAGPNEKTIEVTSVGCGASLGAGDSPLALNIINLAPSSKSFSVSFYADTKWSGGFELVKISRQIIA